VAPAPTPKTDDRAETLVASYERAGYGRAQAAILQPAEPFLDLSGEDIRSRMYFVSDAAGRELCLRPDLTIPVALDYLASEAAGRPAMFSYLGPVFRQRADGPGEFLQAGVESFGRGDVAAADAEILTLALEAAAHYGLDAPTIRLGDIGLFGALVEALSLPPAWQRRLRKDFNRKSNLAQDLDRLTANGHSAHDGVLAALANTDRDGARALVADLLSIAGITAIGGRSVGEIADRFLEQAELGASRTLPKETRAVIDRFLAVKGEPDEALAELRALATEASLKLDPALDLFERRTGFLAARGVDVRGIDFATAFGRSVDYYTGMVFELHGPASRVDGPIAAGGRYDALLARLGKGAAIPAIGFAAWIERLTALGAAP
jgi:ATP phosphoribosyltransferase regulatory subunit